MAIGRAVVAGAVRLLASVLVPAIGLTAIGVAAVGVVSVGGGGAEAAELLMFEQRACPFCAAFNREIAPDYARSRAGGVASLRHVDIWTSRTGGIEGLDPAVFTPTFVLVDKGREIGRLLGYPGRRHFYPEIDRLIDRISPPANPRDGD